MAARGRKRRNTVTIDAPPSPTEGTRDPETFTYSDLAAALQVSVIEAQARIKVLDGRIDLGITERDRLYGFLQGANTSLGQNNAAPPIASVGSATISKFAR